MLSLSVPHVSVPILTDEHLSRLNNALNDGEVVCIFPEGRLTSNGELGEFRPGVEKILERNPVPVIPMALKGLWGSFQPQRSDMLSQNDRLVLVKSGCCNR